MGLLSDNLWKLGAPGLSLAVVLSACGTVPAPVVIQHAMPASSESGVVKSLQKQIRERDKRIEELEAQLDAFKIIDQDFDKRRRLLRPPATVIPIE